jgi:four helix bundle protein
MNESARSFKDLIVWQKAHSFVLDIYKVSKDFPKEELYGLISQIRRSSVSIPANIAEGFKKRTKAEKSRYYNIAQGSLEETRYYLILSNDLKYLQSSELLNKIGEISKMLDSYIKKISE